MRLSFLALLMAVWLSAGARPAGAAHRSAATGTPIPTVGPLFFPSVVGIGPTLRFPHYCSASVVDSPGADLVLTAAHCVYGTGLGIEFAPGYHDGVSPFGVWAVRRVYLDPAWLHGHDPQLDFAVLQLARHHGVGVEHATGSAPALGRAPASGSSVTVAGYVAGSGWRADQMHRARLLHRRLSQLRLRRIRGRDERRAVARRRSARRRHRRAVRRRVHAEHLLQRCIRCGRRRAAHPCRSRRAGRRGAAAGSGRLLTRRVSTAGH